MADDDIRALERAIADNAGNGARLRLANALARADRHGEAIAALRVAIRRKGAGTRV
jgi:hypothetical protein